MPVNVPIQGQNLKNRLILTLLQMRLLALSICIFFSGITIPGKSESPFTLKPSIDYIILGSGTGTYLATYFVFDKNKSLSKEYINSLSYNNINNFDQRAVHNWSVNAAYASKAAMALTISGMAPLVASSEIRNDALTIGIMSAETLIWALSIPQLSKITISRNRPYVYNESVDIKHKLESRATESFFSRTTTLAFASSVFSATLFDNYYPDSPYSKWIWAGTLSMASTAGYLKFYSGEHFPTDIITGAIMGSFIGWFIPHIHKNEKNNSNDITFNIYPLSEGVAATLMLKL